MRQIEIGYKNLIDITSDEILDLIMIEGVCLSLDYWDKPIISSIDNTMFPDTVVVDYQSTRKDDGIKGMQIEFFLNTKSFSYHYNKIVQLDKIMGKNSRLGLEALSYLINKGYNVPL